MRVSCVLALMTVLVSLSVCAQDTPSALESDPKGWEDLLSGLGLAGWTILPVPAEAPLGQVMQWRKDPSREILVCEGNGGHEWLRYDRDLKDFVVHVEWRFTPITASKGYNSGIYVRNSSDGKIWHQGQTGAGAGGFIFGDTPVKGEIKRVNLQKTSVAGRVKPAGEWNVFEFTCRGPRIQLWVNGAVTSEMSDCEALQGYFGLEAEGYRIEFRNIKLKVL